MAKPTPTAGGLGALMGGAHAKPHHVAPGWLKLVGLAAGLLTLWRLAGSLGAFLFLGLTGAYVVWSWIREKENVVDSIMNWLFILALLATALRGGIIKASDGVRDLGPAVGDVATEGVREVWPDSSPTVQTVPPITLPPAADPAPVQVATP